MPIPYVGKTVVISHCNSNHELNNVFYVSICSRTWCQYLNWHQQTTSSCLDLMVPRCTTIGRIRAKSIYVMLAEDAYVDKERHPKTEFIDYSSEQCYLSRDVTVDKTSLWKASKLERHLRTGGFLKNDLNKW